MAMSVLRGIGVALVVVTPIWWLPSLLQQAIPDFWLAVMTAPPVMLGGYVAARRAPRPILAGVLAGLATMMVVLTVAITSQELWVIPIMMLFGAAFAGLGAYLAVLAGHAAARKL